MRKEMPEYKLSNAWAYIAIILLVILFADKLSDDPAVNPLAKGHECRWELCPYKGITMDHRGDAVRSYTGTDGGDAFAIDVLHFEFPDADYDALEEMLFED